MFDWQVKGKKVSLLSLRRTVGDRVMQSIRSSYASECGEIANWPGQEPRYIMFEEEKIEPLITQILEMIEQKRIDPDEPKAIEVKPIIPNGDFIFQIDTESIRNIKLTIDA